MNVKLQWEFIVFEVIPRYFVSAGYGICHVKLSKPCTGRFHKTGKITITWKPAICIHSRICWHSQREVFDPARRL
jgi:Divergent 4Fe-4S mono-cluster